MSDKPRKEASSAAGAKGPKQPSKLMARLKALSSLCREIEKDDDGEILDYEALLTQVRGLKDQVEGYKSQLASRDAEITALRQQKDDMSTSYEAQKSTLMTSFAKQASIWTQDTSDKEKLQKENDDLRKMLNDARAKLPRLAELEAHSKKLDAALKDSEARIAALTRDREKTRRNMELMEQSLDEYQEDLHKLQQETGIAELPLAEMYVPSPPMAL